MERRRHAGLRTFPMRRTAGPAIIVMLILAGCASPPARHARAPGVHALQSHVSLDPAQRNNVVLTALSMVDTPYHYGGNSPDEGFDCSGLVSYVFGDATQHALPHRAASIARISRSIPRTQLAAGDLVFFNTLNRPYSHMGIYIGDGQFVNAPSSGGRVRVDSLSNPYYARHFEAAATLFAN